MWVLFHIILLVVCYCCCCFFPLTLSDLFVLKHFYFMIDNIDEPKKSTDNNNNNIHIKYVSNDLYFGVCVCVCVWSTKLLLWCEWHKIFFLFISSSIVFFLSVRRFLLGLLDGKISQRIVYWNKGGMGLGSGRLAGG